MSTDKYTMNTDDGYNIIDAVDLPDHHSYCDVYGMLSDRQKESFAGILIDAADAFFDSEMPSDEKEKFVDLIVEDMDEYCGVS